MQRKESFKIYFRMNDRTLMWKKSFRHFWAAR